MDFIFQLVVVILNVIGDLTGLTYNEINIVVYYIIIPFTWAILLDEILKIHYLKLSYALIVLVSLVIIKDFSLFSNWLFQKSVDFLCFLGDYIIMSVLVCVVLVIVVYMVLFYFAFFNKTPLFNSSKQPEIKQNKNQN